MEKFPTLQPMNSTKNTLTFNVPMGNAIETTLKTINKYPKAATIARDCLVVGAFITMLRFLGKNR